MPNARKKPRVRRRAQRSNDPRPARRRYAEDHSITRRGARGGGAELDQVDGSVADPEAALGGPFDPAASAELDRRDNDPETGA
jgi:hypothetical protein